MVHQRKIFLIVNLIIMGILLFSQMDGVWAFDWEEQPKLKSSRIISPYSFYPKGRYVPPVRTERRPLMSVAPRPLIVTDGDGNKILYRRDRAKGDRARSVAIRVDPQGNVTYYSRNQKRFRKDYEGELTHRYIYHSPICEIRNEAGGIIGYEEYGRGGLLLRRYDEDGVLIETFKYRGRILELIIDELTGAKVEYGLYGPEREYDGYGNLIGYWVRDEKGRVKYKVERTVDIDGKIIEENKVYYDSKGRNFLYATDSEGFIRNFKYGTFWRLEEITDQYGNIVRYEKGKPVLMIINDDYEGVKITLTKEWTWQGSLLLQTTTTVHSEEVDNRLVTTDSEEVVRYFYREGRLIGAEGFTTFSGTKEDCYTFKGKTETEYTIIKDQAVASKSNTITTYWDIYDDEYRTTYTEIEYLYEVIAGRPLLIEASEHTEDIYGDGNYNIVDVTTTYNYDDIGSILSVSGEGESEGRELTDDGWMDYTGTIEREYDVLYEEIRSKNITAGDFLGAQTRRRNHKIIRSTEEKEYFPPEEVK